MKKMILSTAMAIAFSMTAMPSFAAKINFAFVDMQKVAQEAPQVKEIQKKMQKDFEPRQQKIVAAQNDMQEDIKKLQRDGSTMKKADREALQKKIVAEQKELQKMQSSLSQAARKEQTELATKFQKKLQSVIEKKAKAEHFDIVVARSSVLYAPDTADITDAVLKVLKK